MQSLVDAALKALPAYAGISAFLFACGFAALVSIAVTKAGTAISMRALRALKKQAPKGAPPAAEHSIKNETNTNELKPALFSWAERARAAYPLRLFTGLNVVLAPAFSVGFTIVILRDSISILPNWLTATAAALISLIWPLRGRLQTEREVRSLELPRKRWLRGGCTLWILMAPHLAVAVVISIVMPADFGPATLLLIGLCFALSLSIIRMSPLPLLKALGLAKPASARLSGIVAKSVEKTKLSPRGVYEIELPWANAYAFPMAKRLAFSDELLAHLNDDEVDAVCAHEFGHLAEGAGVVATRVLSALTLLVPLLLVKPLTATGRPEYVLFVFLGAFVFLSLVRRIFRRMEVHADKKAHAHEGDAGTYARALVRIYEVNVMPVVLSKGSGVHPDLYDRVASAGAPFPFPRPKAPARISLLFSFLAAMGIYVAAMVGSLVALDWALASQYGSGGAAETMLLTIRGKAIDCARLAGACEQANQKDCALSFYGLAAERDVTSPVYPSQLARLLAEKGQCEAASEELAEAAENIGFMGASLPDYQNAILESAQKAVLACYERRGIPSNTM